MGPFFVVLLRMRCHGRVRYAGRAAYPVRNKLALKRVLDRYLLNPHGLTINKWKRRGQFLTLHSSIAICWHGVRGVDSIAVWAFEMRDADTLKRSAIMVSGSLGRARCKVKN